MIDVDASRTDLKGMTLPELEEFLSRWGKERYRARQLFRWIYQKHVDDFAAMTDLSKELRGILAASCRVSGFPAERVDISADGTEKYLFRLEDGESVESVLIPDEGRRTLCISSQVGCPLLCGFCATGAAGFRRNMTSAEIVQQACFAAKRLEERGSACRTSSSWGWGAAAERPGSFADDRDPPVAVRIRHLGKRSPSQRRGSFRRCFRSR